MRTYLFLVLFVLLGFYAPVLQAGIINVPGDQPTIQAGIDAAVDGDTVMIAPGTYFEYSLDFLGKAITVMSTDPEDPSVVAATVVDGGSQGSVFYFHTGEGSTSVLAGLTITGGWASWRGAGILCVSSSPTITYNLITGNSTDSQGGGIYSDSSPIITNNTISGNSSGLYGGGIIVPGGSPTIAENIISGNSAGKGGGIYCDSSSPVIVNNVISGNSSSMDGGGIECHYTSSPEISNNIITGNSAGEDGGGIFCDYSSSPTITNTTITGNTAGGSGGGMRIEYNSSPIITNTILWGNDAPTEPEISRSGGELVVTYSDIGGGWPGTGNIDADPLFEAPGLSDYHLQAGSPCIDAGDPTILDACLPPGLGGDGSDMGAYGGSDNCWWPEVSTSLLLSPVGPLEIPRGGVLEFGSLIRNNTESNVAGDYWLSVLLPNSSEIVIPEALLSHPNPLTGQIPAFDFFNFSSELNVPTQVDTGPYTLIGRIGIYPNTIIDEDSLDFQVIE